MSDDRRTTSTFLAQYTVERKERAQSIVELSILSHWQTVIKWPLTLAKLWDLRFLKNLKPPFGNVLLGYSVYVAQVIWVKEATGHP